MMVRSALCNSHYDNEEQKQMHRLCDTFIYMSAHVRCVLVWTAVPVTAALLGRTSRNVPSFSMPDTGPVRRLFARISLCRRELLIISEANASIGPDNRFPDRSAISSSCWAPSDGDTGPCTPPSQVRACTNHTVRVTMIEACEPKL